MPKTPRREAIDAIGKWVTAVATVAGLLWAAYNTVQTRALEARKPFLDLQLKLYQDATESAATLATSMDPKVLEENEARFWRESPSILHESRCQVTHHTRRTD